MGVIWLLLSAAALVVSIFALDSRRRRTGVVVALSAALAAALSLLPSRHVPPTTQPTSPSASELDAHEFFAAHTPQQQSADGYISSASCSECHPREFNAWHASYHRTMTQLATPAAVLGDFADRRVEFDGVSYRLTRRGDEFWVTVSLPGGAGTAPQTIERPVLLTTGSHHMQVYWLPTGEGRTVAELPIYFLKDEQRWVPRDASFLKPPSSNPSSPDIGRWNQECINCHTTHGRSRVRTSEGALAADSQVAEFGIACEACHGPADQHVKSRRGEDIADTIVNPARLPSKLSAQVCGRCHGITVPRQQSELAGLLEHGYGFRPGNELTETLHLVQRDQATRDRLKAGIVPSDHHVDVAMDLQFWADGMVRVSGREFNGLVRSTCYQKGEMSCLSCHVLHQAEGDPRGASDWADDQLRADALGDTACTQCHAAQRYAAQTHTHHADASSGSRCYNCHTPYTTYGLLKAIRSHTIDSPDTATSVRTGRPNACNLCHLDRTLDWTARQLEEWYDISPPELTDDQQTISAAALWSLQGDAGQRVLAAWHMGWSPAVEVSGTGWLPPYLATLLDDPYPAVRFNAAHSLRRVAGFEDFDYDYVGTADHRQSAARQVLQTWRNKLPAAAGLRLQLPDHVLLSTDGTLRQDVFDRLLRERDNKPVTLAE